jgi:DNA-binding transcriptional LysR family regulator
MSRIAQLPNAVVSELNGVVAVAAHRSFRRASAELGVSASALSHSVASLEERLGVKLFHRTTRSVSLSDAGARFLARAQPALQQIADAMDTANEFRGTPRGTLRINAAASAAGRIFEPLVVPFLARHPEMHVEIVADNRLVDIVAGGFDAGIRLKEAVPRDMVAVPIGPPMRFLVVGSPAYFAKHQRPRTPADLLNHRCIRRRRASGVMLPWELEKGGKVIEVDVQGRLTLDDEQLVLAAVLGGLGLAWMSSWTVEPLIKQKRLRAVLEDWSEPFPGICLYYPPHRHMSAGLRAFIDLAVSLDLAGKRA